MYKQAKDMYYTIVFCCSELAETKITQRENRDGLYDISATVTLPDIVLDTPTVFECELRIPEANYTVRREYVYIPGEEHSVNCNMVS